MSKAQPMIQGRITVHAAQDAPVGQPVKFRGVAYEGGVLRVAAFSRGVVVDLDGLTIPEALPISADHRFDLDARLGTATAHVEDGRRLIVEGLIVPGTEAADRAINLLRHGGLSLSINAMAQRMERIREGATAEANNRTFKGAVDIAREAELVEVSAVGVGADGGAVAVAARSAYKEEVMNVIRTEEVDPVAEERRRVQEIHAAFSGLDSRDAISERDRLIESGADLAEARGAALAMLRAARPSVFAVRGRGGGGAPTRDILAAAAVGLAGGDVEKLFGATVASRASDLNCGSMLALCERALTLEGQIPPRSRSELISAAFSTTSLPHALGAGIERVAMDAFRTAPEVWPTIGRIVPLRSFKETQLVRLAASARFEPVGPDGELKHSLVGEEAGKIRLATFGRIVGLSRQSIIDDDLGLFNDLPNELGREAARTIGDLVYDTLDANADNFFSSANANELAGPQSALSVDGVAKAIELMRLQRDAGGRIINIAPRFLVCGAGLEAQARAVLNSLEVEVEIGEPRGNPVRQSLELLIDPRIPTPVWYVFAAASDGALAIGLLDGRRGATVEQVPTPAEKLGAQWRAYLDAAAALREPRAAVRALGE